ncbi:MAG: BON domain-containing protein [Gemmataceae bacterium]
MKLRLFIAPVAAAIGLGIANGQEPGRLPVAETNQQLADSVAAKLTAGTTAQGADVSISAQSGIVTLTGSCKDAAQKTAILNMARTTKGVSLVKDGLVAGSITQVQAQDAPAALPPVAGPRGPVAAPIFSNIPSAGASGPMVEPTPLGAAGSGSMDPGAPPLPANAWPTYAPYPNISRVAYPEAYPYNAFPFIGPYYPFPKVPMGWRSVSLKWEDGHWYMGRTSTPYDYWRVRFW